MRYVLVIAVVVSVFHCQALGQNAGEEFFESRIRPVLAEHCYRCHSAEAQEKKKLRGGLRVDLRDDLRKGGDSGPAVVPGKPHEGTLLKALRYEGELRMPPQGKLPPETIAAFEKWIAMGAPDPRDGKPIQTVRTVDFRKAAKEHWSFRPLQRPQSPLIEDRSWVRTPVDVFVRQRMETASLKPAAPALPHVWLRRVYLDLIGLPPTPKEQAAFLAAPTPEAQARVVDDLLSRPQYGERWGRHWLDVARYAESSGFEGDGPKPLAWKYRDYVIDAFNRDMPFDQFVREQVAGDEIEGASAKSHVGATFLRLGPFEGNATFKAVARYNSLDDVVGTTFMAFLGLNLQCARCHDHKFEPLTQVDYHRILAVFEPLESKENTAPIGSERDFADFRKREADYQAKIEALFAPVNELRLKFLEDNPPAALAADPANKISKADAELLLNLLRRTPEQWSKLPEQKRMEERKGLRLDGRMAALDAVIRGRTDQATKEKFDRLLADAKEALKNPPVQPMAHVFEEGPTTKSHLFIRGNIEARGREVVPGVPEIFGGADMPEPDKRRFARSSGRRRWLAEWLTGEMRPLIARVLANRLWQYHFGRGLLTDANNAGLSGGVPVDPQLLEWLASEVAENGWKLKPLHRQIVLSATYAQSARHPEAAKDPEAALFSRWRPRVLEAEALHDCMWAVADRLDLTMGGESEFKVSGRRAVYLRAGRVNRGEVLEILGMPENSQSVSQRPKIVSPLQSLFLMNSPFVAGRAKAFAARVKKEAGVEASSQVDFAFRVAFCRPPTDIDLAESLRFLREFRARADSLDGLETLCLSLLNANEFLYID